MKPIILPKSNGLQFGLHNHWWEYRNKVDGKFVYEVLLESVEPDIFFEIDTYWVKVAGHDPAEIVAKFGKRAPSTYISKMARPGGLIPFLQINRNP